MWHHFSLLFISYPFTLYALEQGLHLSCNPSCKMCATVYYYSAKVLHSGMVLANRFS